MNIEAPKTIVHLDAVATTGGNHALIDTLEENLLAQCVLQADLSELVRICTKDNNPGCSSLHFETLNALQTLQNNPLGKFTINHAPRYDFPLCHGEKQDCYEMLMLLGSNVHAVLPIYSGGTFSTKVDNISIAEKVWEKVVAPLNVPSKTPNEERENLAKTVDNFENMVASPDDWNGWIGNMLPLRGQQDCIQESISLVTFFQMLSAEGYLHFHHLNEKHAIDGIAMFHYTAIIYDNGERSYSVDPWFGKTSVTPLQDLQAGYSDMAKDFTGIVR